MSYNRTSGRASGKRHANPFLSGDAQNLLLPVLRNDNDPNYALRSAAADQFWASLVQAPAVYLNGTGRSDIISLYAKELFAALSDTRSPLAYKNKLSKCIAGIGLSYIASGQSATFTGWIFESMSSTVAGSKSKDADKDLRNWLLTALKEFVDATSSQPARLHKEIQIALATILHQMQAFVDTMDSADYMPKTLDLFQIIAEIAPEQFSASFKDVVDLLVGWSIDPTLPKNVAALIFDTFKKLWCFWMPHIGFALELSRHLLGDIEASVKLSCEPRIASNDDATPKSTSHRSGRLPSNAFVLIRCLQSILYVLTYSGSPKLNPDCALVLGDDASGYQDYTHVVAWLLGVVESVGSKYRDRAWLVQGFGFLKFVSKALGAAFSPFHKQAIRIVMLDCSLFSAELAQEKKDPKSAEKDLLEWMSNFSEIIDPWLPDLSTDLLPDFTCPSSSPLLQDFRYACLSAVLCTEKLHTIMTTVLEALSASYGKTGSQTSAQISENKEELLSECAFLARSVMADPAEMHPQPESGYFAALVLRGEEVLSDILLDDIYLVSLAAELALPGFSGHDVLLLLCSFVVGMTNADHVRKLRYNRGQLLLAAYSVARSEHFVGDAKASDVKSALRMQFDAIRSTLSVNELTHNEKLLCIVWFDELLASLKASLFIHEDVIPAWIDDITEAVENCIAGFMQLCDFEHDPRVREQMACVWKSYDLWLDSGFPALSLETIRGRMEYLNELALKCIDDIDPMVRSAYSEVASSIHPVSAAFTRGENRSKATRQARLELMAMPPSGTFRSKHFQLVASFLGMHDRIIVGDDAPPSEPPDREDMTWLQRVYHACQTCSFAESEMGSGSGSRHQEWEKCAAHERCGSFLEYWALWESARYCILSRLRTPLGAPLQTFEAIEASLKDAIATLERYADETATLESGLASISHQVRDLRNLIMFVDMLEIQFQNACEGSLHCAPAPRPSISFFYTNKKSCEEWFARVRKLVVTGARLSGASDVAIKQASQFLMESTSGKERNFALADTADVVRILADELIVNGEPDSLIGIGDWMQRNGLHESDIPLEDEEQTITLLKRKDAVVAALEDVKTVTWCKPSRLLAEGRYETALGELLKAQANTSAIRDDAAQRWLNRHIAECYLSLQDWRGFDEWQAKLHVAGAETALEETTRTGYNEILGLWGELSEATAQKPIIPTAVPSTLDIRPMVERGFLDAVVQSSNTYVLSGLLRLKEAGPLENENACHAVDVALSMWAREDFPCNSEVLLGARLLHLLQPAASRPHYRRSGLSVSHDLKNLTPLKPLALNLLRDSLSVLEPASNAVGGVDMLLRRIARKRGNLACAVRMAASDSLSSIAPSHLHKYEAAKLAFVMGQPATALRTLADLYMESPAAAGASASPALFESKLLVRLAGWAVQSHGVIRSDASLADDLSAIADGEPSRELVEPPERLARQLLVRAVTKDGTNQKAWFQLAGHIYRSARKAADLAAVSTRQPDDMQHAALRKITVLISSESESQEATVKTFCSIISDALESPYDSATDNCIEEAFPHLPSVLCEQVQAVVRTETASLEDQLYDAAKAYFKFLDITCSADTACNANCATATLRVLRIFLKYGSVRKRLAPFFETTAVTPWKMMVPQLHSRINHPDDAVRNTFAALLSRIGQVAPHLIVYHAFAEPNVAKVSSATAVTSQVLTALRQQEPKLLVPQVEGLIRELRRITVFWEETWLHKLASVQAEATKRLQRIEGEVRRVRGNDALSDSEKDGLVLEYYRTIMKPLVNSLEKIFETTQCTAASTPHERWFETTYGARIRAALDSLIEPADLSAPKNTWQKFQEIHADLNRELQRVRILKLADVSPHMAKFRNSVVPMPGHLGQKGPVTVQSFAAELHVMPSKTKPKKLQLIGSDGVTYPYLFKGLEDLHLDERIQQLLGIINQFLLNDKAAAARNLRARTYTVIPCGRRFGMIQWVEDVTPFFSLYKRWQQRDYSAKLLQQKEGGTKADIPAPLRSNEQFYAQIGPALKKLGLSRKTPRHEWPLVAMREALEKLKRETPNNLISREIFCGSASAHHWWSKQKTFARSTAVMSMIGYVIGLGDRHLDNILLDQASGEIVHIDFNVCFENGAKLRVPETVPFRLTQNIHAALGVTGTDGVFRIASEHAMRVMRENREALLVLLEAFVYDPLVDWTRAASEEVKRRELELNVNIGVLASRVAEKRDLIEKKIYSLLASCGAVEVSIKCAYPALDESRSGLGKRHASSDEEIAQIIDELAARKVEIDRWASQHSTALLSLKVKCSFLKLPRQEYNFYTPYWMQGPILQACASEVFNLGPSGTFPPVAPSAYMLGPSEAHMMRCVEVDQELFRVGALKTACYSRCFKHLQLYQALAAPVSNNLLAQDPFVRWSGLLSQVLSAPSDQAAYEQIYSYEFEESLTTQTRKAALEAVMKSTCVAKEAEWQKAKEALEMFEEGAGADAMEPYSAIFGTAAPYKNSDLIVESFMLSELADLGHLMFAWIKDPTQAAEITSDIAAIVNSSAMKSRNIFGNYCIHPDRVFEVHAMLAYASVSAGIIEGVVGKTAGASQPPALQGIAPSSLGAFVALSTCVRDMAWHLADVFMPELILLLATGDGSQTDKLMEEIAAISSRVELTFEQTSAQFQTAAKAMTRDFATLCSRYAYRPGETPHVVLECFGPLFGPITTAVRELSQQLGTAEASIIQNVLTAQQVLTVQSVLSACRAYVSSSEMEVDDPTHEWAANYDFREIMSENEVFKEATSALKKYLDICMREVLMKPLAKLFSKTIKRLVGKTAKSARSPAQPATGIPFVDTALEAVQAKRSAHSDVGPTLNLMRQWHAHQCLPTLNAALQREGAAHLNKCDARLQLRRLALYRYQLVHEAALTFPARRAGVLSTSTPRWQFITHIGDEIPLLVQLSNDLVSLEKICQMTDDALGPVITWARQDPSLADAVEAFVQLANARHGQILIETKRAAIRELSANYTESDKLFDDVHQIISTLLKMSGKIPAAQPLRDDLQSHLSKWSEIGKLITGQLLIAKNDHSLADGESMLRIARDIKSDAEHCLKSMCAFASLRAVESSTRGGNNGDPEEGRTAPLHLVLDPQATPGPNGEGPDGPDPRTGALDAEEEDQGNLRQKSLSLPESLGQEGLDDPCSEERSGDETADDRAPGAPQAVQERRMSDAASAPPVGAALPKGSQARNAYAVGVLRRIKAKLEGRDMADEPKSDVGRQVERVISEAADADRISTMYEGWMGWI
ncbi:Serine/threonine-protein kinase smg1 [Geranomyces variabilis]|uniref:non-specific serine/threonine protein kinase n=1 Tax=Geranomyces variabilis TaxID=109894 RepID=A0AAD5XP09_9FUNG|nr:Serine/threonine-protein kinase smg1 [Geranomyces variabilis]